ncbi:ZrgA family zinc uptake protein [Neptuniibacter sp. QD72_48]|uniref:ZrgA family zinc uptake protein n=1 Tax=unclassified Neptuniibacter TaxID=2630693 RepID=UPI0039F6CE5A
MILNKAFRLAAVSTAVLASSVMAESHQHEAHVHGIAELNFVIEGNVAEMELRSPLMNIAGFEHEAVSAEDKQKIKSATKQLKDAYARVKFPDDALCIVDDAKVTIGEEEDEHAHHDHAVHHDKHHGYKDDHHKHDDHHDHSDHHDHKHEDHHGHDKHHDHADHHDHEKHHDHGEETHRNITAHYHFQCVNPAKINAVTLDFFSHFPHMETVKVNVLNGADIRSVELTPKQRVLEL